MERRRAGRDRARAVDGGGALSMTAAAMARCPFWALSRRPQRGRRSRAAAAAARRELTHRRRAAAPPAGESGPCAPAGP
eukprot:3704134-Prymnesium_polylepis.1